MGRGKEKLCVLNNILWVPTEYVEEEAREDFTYRFEEVEYHPNLDLPPQCSNCDLWGKKWRPGRTTCEQKGYTIHDVCKHFSHKKIPISKEIVLKTYQDRPDGWTTFARGDIGKIKKHFAHLGVSDERVAPKLDFDLKCVRELYPEQKEVVEKWLSKRYGIIQAPTAFGKCLGRGTPVLLYDGTIKKAEEVEKGDLLMGPDSLPRRVVSTCMGVENMYRISPTKGDPYIVNESHVLSLKLTKSKKTDKVELVNISVRDYLNKSKWFKHRAKGWRTGVDFSGVPAHMDMPPYILGIWLGDGASKLPAVTTKDEEIEGELRRYAATLDLEVRPDETGGRCPTYHITSRRKEKGSNRMINALKEIGVWNNKHIPHSYKTASRENRLELLAGLLDSDGSRVSECYEFVSKLEVLADDVCFLARSLGLAASKKETTKMCTNTGVSGKYYRVNISGPCSIIPCRVERKKAPSRNRRKDHLVVGIKVEPIGVDEYFGFEIEGPDRLFLLGDFTVTHNTVMFSWLVSHLGLRTILLAQEVRHLMVGFEGLYEHTNIAEVEEQAGEHLIGILNKDWKWVVDKDGHKVRKWMTRKGKHYPITFATFQSLASAGGIKLRKRLRNDFGLLWTEECHHESAPTFHAATRSFNAKYRGGQTATPSRKDKTHVAIFDTLGPVTAQGTKEAMTPIVHFHSSNVLVPDRIFKGKFILPQLVNFLARNAAYQECLYEEIIKECEEGRKILLVTERRNHAFRMQQKIKLQGFGCELIIGGQEMKDQNWYAEELLSGRVSVLIGTQVINENVNIPPLDSIHQPFPNFGKEREEQRVGRVRRYLSGSNYKFLEENGIDWDKPQPRVHIYTWHAGHGMAGSAVGFRDKLYKKWGFDFAQSAESLPKKKTAKTMKDWLKDFDENDDKPNPNEI